MTAKQFVPSMYLGQSFRSLDSINKLGLVGSPTPVSQAGTRFQVATFWAWFPSI